MLNEFRTLAGSLWAKILLVFLVMTFAVWGVGDMLRHPGGAQTVATVGDMTISRDEFLRALRHEMDTMRSIMGEHYSPELLKSLHIEDRVMQQLISQDLLKLESQSLGIIPSDAA